MSEADAVALIDEVEMRINLNNVDRLLSLKGVDAWNIDRMIASQHNRKSARRQDFAYA